jgi:5'-nucleotidase
MIVKGKQMIEVLNKCHIAASCLGNHDFDFGLDVLLSRISESNFPWLLSNVFDIETKKPLGNVEIMKIIEFNGLKIGVIALIEEEW